MKIVGILMVLLALSVGALSASEISTSPADKPQSASCPSASTPPSGMLNIFDLATNASAAQSHRKEKGGSSVQSLASGGWWYYCYSDPGTVYDCDLGSWECQQECEQVCGGHCDWDET